MKTLHLNLKKKWFDMILSGEKKEEYREIKPYWINRLCESFSGGHTEDGLFFEMENKEYGTITFTNGYQKNSPQFAIECKGIEIGTPKPEWSDNWQGEVFLLRLGEIL